MHIHVYTESLFLPAHQIYGAKLGIFLRIITKSSIDSAPADFGPKCDRDTLNSLHTRGFAGLHGFRASGKIFDNFEISSFANVVSLEQSEYDQRGNSGCGGGGYRGGESGCGDGSGCRCSCSYGCGSG